MPSPLRPIGLAFVALATAVVLTTGWALPATAHDFDPERQLLVQAFPGHVDIMILYTEAPGERTDFFAAQFGLELEGELGAALDELARRAILLRMLDGLEFEVEGERPRTGEPEVQLRDDDSRLQAAAFVRYELDDLDDDARRTVVIRAKDRSFIPTRTVVYGGDGLWPAQLDGEPFDGPAVDVNLRRGDEVRTVFQWQ